MPDYTVFVNVRHSVDVEGAASLKDAIKEAIDTYQGNSPTIVIEVYDAEGQLLAGNIQLDSLSSATDSES